MFCSCGEWPRLGSFGLEAMIDCSQGQISDDRWAFLCDSFIKDQGGRRLSARTMKQLLDRYEVVPGRAFAQPSPSAGI